MLPCIYKPFCMIRYMKRILNGSHYAFICAILFLFRPHYENIEKQKLWVLLCMTMYGGFIYGFHLDLH